MPPDVVQAAYNSMNPQGMPMLVKNADSSNKAGLNMGNSSGVYTSDEQSYFYLEQAQMQ